MTLSLAKKRKVVRLFKQGVSIDDIFWKHLHPSEQPNYVRELESVLRDAMNEKVNLGRPNPPRSNQQTPPGRNAKPKPAK